MKKNYQGERGFTLVELIVVIIILGVLSAVAIPRFLNQASTARIKALNALAGAINSSVMLSQAQYRSMGNTSNSSVTSISMNGTSVTVVAGSGYPDAVTGGINAALLSTQGFTVTFSSGVATFNFSTAVSNCLLTYTASSASVSVTTSGC